MAMIVQENNDTHSESKSEQKVCRRQDTIKVKTLEVFHKAINYMKSRGTAIAKQSIGIVLEIYNNF